MAAEIEISLVTYPNNYLVVHGVHSDSNNNWFPWLKTVLEKRGDRVMVPDLPLSYHSESVNEWNEVLQKTLGENTDNLIIVGHSMGAPAALNLIQSLNQKVQSLILVAPVSTDLEWPRLETEHSDIQWSTVRKFAEINVDWSKISELVDKVVCYYSDNDPYIPETSIDYYKSNLPKTQLRFMSGRGHFSKHWGMTEFPELLRDFSVADIKVYVNRPEAMYGATYVTIPASSASFAALPQFDDREVSDMDSDLSRLTRELSRIRAVNLANDELLPVWIDAREGGSSLAIPAHDRTAFDFAVTHKLPIKYVIAPETGIKRENEEQRNGGCSVIFDPKTQKYAVALWEDTRFRLFAGGVEEGEGITEGILREATEESGLYDFGYVEIVGIAFTHFYNWRKKVNRSAEATCLLVILNSTQTVDVKQEDHEKLRLAWRSAEEVLENWADHNQEHDLDH
jgi:predicted alpha/beta hydrolase family esterase/ADP-ribose pyrophosphatase YjhB (NUDIX family)